jgi:hypothetical protein
MVPKRLQGTEKVLPNQDQIDYMCDNDFKEPELCARELAAVQDFELHDWLERVGKPIWKLTCDIEGIKRTHRELIKLGTSDSKLLKNGPNQEQIRFIKEQGFDDPEGCARELLDIPKLKLHKWYEDVGKKPEWGLNPKKCPYSEIQIIYKTLKDLGNKAKKQNLEAPTLRNTVSNNSNSCLIENNSFWKQESSENNAQSESIASYQAVQTHHQENVRWICELCKKEPQLKINELDEQIRKHLTEIVDEFPPNAQISIPLQSEIQGKNYGQPFYITDIVNRQVSPGLYWDDSIGHALIVQFGQAIGFSLTKNQSGYNEVLEMKGNLICRRKSDTIPWRRSHCMDCNKNVNKIVVPNYISRCLAAAMQYVHRNCMNTIGFNVIHTRGHAICNKPDGDFKKEAALFRFVRGLLNPNIEVLGNRRLEEMQRLEFDIWIPCFKVAIEYQGEQHVKPIPKYGGEEGLCYRKANDKRKRELAKSNGYVLKEMWYYDEMNKETVKNLLLSANIPKEAFRN